MSTPTGTWSTTGPVQPAPGWWKRNWKWLTGVIVVAFVVAVVALIVGITSLVMWSIRQSDVYKLAMDKLSHSPAVVARLGTPLKPGWLISGSLSTGGDNGSADLTIPISGPKGAAKAYVSARKQMGEWTFTSLLVRTEAGEKILLEPGDSRQLGPGKPPD